VILYLLADTSGSTARNRFNDAWNQALPRLVDTIGDTAGLDTRICLMSYATEAQIRIPLACVEDIVAIPWMAPTGLSSLVAGLRLLRRTVHEDRHQLASDGIATGGVTALVVTDGLPTDRDADVLAERDRLDVAGITLHVACPVGPEALAFAGLRATLHPIAGATTGEVASAIVAAARSSVERSPVP